MIILKNKNEKKNTKLQEKKLNLTLIFKREHYNGDLNNI